jgi:hypothetical protein
MTDHTTTVTAVEVARIDAAAKALAAAHGKNRDSADIRTHYRGLALTAVGAYFAAPAAETTVQEGQQS